MGYKAPSAEDDKRFSYRPWPNKADKTQRVMAREWFAAEKRRRRIPPEPCAICGQKAEAHHECYQRPLDVVWLCKKHHCRCHAIGLIELLKEALG